MVRRLAAVAVLVLSQPAAGQQPIPLLPPRAADTPASPPAIEQEPAPAASPTVEQAPVERPALEQPSAEQPPTERPLADQPTTPAAPAAQSRIFCGQSVSARPADAASVPQAFRSFVGIWSDAAWTAQLCAALVVENVTADGTATITYAFGPIGSGSRVPGGVLHGTGVIRDGELLFQNNDGSQYSFKPFYADLAGRLITPQGPTYDAVFKKTY